MTEEERLVACAVMEKLNALSHAVDAVTVLLAVQAAPYGEQRNELLDKAEELGRLREESDERAIGYAEKVSEMWGAEDD